MVEIFSYNLWANERLALNLESLESKLKDPLPISFGSFYRLLLHLCDYDSKIYQKMVKGAADVVVDDSFAPAALLEFIIASSNRWLDWSRSLLSENEGIGFEAYSELLNLYNHNIYHRGQMTAVLAMLGHQPSSLDIYIYRGHC